MYVYTHKHTIEMLILYRIYVYSFFFFFIFRLPDDIWLVDLDSNRLTPPTGSHDDIPLLPEPEGTILKNHLKQVSFNDMSI